MHNLSRSIISAAILAALIFPKANANSLKGDSISPWTPSSGVTTATGSSTPRALSSRAADVFNAKDYGAIGDGTVHTIASTLGITTLAGLEAYTINGKQPYAGIGQSPVGNYAALPAMQGMASGATQIPMYTIVTVGGPFYTGPIPAGSTFIPIGYDGLSVGMGNLKPNMQCGNSSGVTPGSAIFVINPAASTIELSTPTTASMSAGATFTCGYNLSNIAVGATVTGFNLAANTKVVGISNAGMSQSIQISPGVTAGEAAFTPFEFWSPVTDSQVANATMDWLGIQAAYVAAGNNVPVGATTQKGGGTVFIPNGFYISNLGLQIPQQNEVDTKGSGEESTILNWNTDTGPGTCYLNDGFRLTGLNIGEEKYNVIQDLNILGPVEEFTFGSTNVNACGISVNGYKKIENTQVQLTFAGVVNNGGQGTMYNMNISHNYYGVYFDMPDTYGNFGDNLFENIEIDGATMADVACSVSFCDPGSTWLRSGFFAAPYGYFTETYGTPGALLGGQAAGLILDHNELINVQAENIGHAMIGDDRPFGQSVSLGEAVIFEHFEPWWGPNPTTYQIANSASTKSPEGAIFEMGACNDCTVDTPAEYENWTPGSDGIFDILSSTGFTWRGDLSLILSNAISAPFLSNNMDPTNWRFEANGWSGISCHACGTSAAGVILSYPAAGGATPAASAGTAGEMVLGVSMGATGNNPIIATSGIATVTLGGATNAANVPLRTASSGKAVQASGGNDSTTPVIGLATSSASASGSQVQVRLRLGGL